MKSNDLFPDENKIAAQKAQEDARKVAVFKEKDEWKFMVSDDRGIRFIYRLLKECGVWDSSFKTSSEIYFNEGRRSIGLHLLAELEKQDLGVYMKVIKLKKETEIVGN